MLSDNEESNSDNLARSCPNMYINIKEKLEKNMKNIKLNEMIIKNKIIYKDKTIKIFSKEFVKNNKDNCFIIINDGDEDDEQELKCEIYIDKNSRKQNLLTIKLREINPIIDFKYIFAFCTSLYSFDLSKFDTKKFINMYSMFFGCSSLKQISGASQLNTKLLFTSTITRYVKMGYSKYKIFK